MSYCNNCGRKLLIDSKFCDGCGNPVTNYNDGIGARKTVYEGKEHKCIRCGEVLGAFDSVCPACGYEIRGRKNSNAVVEFAAKIENTETESQRIILIKNFPIPNTKEDIFEFMILASSNLDISGRTDEFNAWYTKFEQCYQKARLSFTNASDISVFQNIYEETTKKIQKAKRARANERLRTYLSQNASVMPQAIMTIGWLISVFVLIVMSGINLDSVGSNPSQLILLLDLVAGAVFVPYLISCEKNLPKIIIAIGLALTIVILIPLCSVNVDSVGTNAYQMLLIVDIIVSVVIFVRTYKLSK